MANHLSAKKRSRQNVKHRERNRSYRAFMRSRIKQLRALIAEGKMEEARQYLPQVIGAIEKTGSRGVIHRKQAARRVSRIAKAVNKQG